MSLSFLGDCSFWVVNFYIYLFESSLLFIALSSSALSLFFYCCKLLKLNLNLFIYCAWVFILSFVSAHSTFYLFYVFNRTISFFNYSIYYLTWLLTCELALLRLLSASSLSFRVLIKIFTSSLMLWCTSVGYLMLRFLWVFKVPSWKVMIIFLRWSAKFAIYISLFSLSIRRSFSWLFGYFLLKSSIYLW